MRRAYHDTKWLTDDTGLVGISLGSDFCAEHEWGVKDLREELGTPQNTMTGLTCEDYIKLSDAERKNLCLDITAIKTTTLPAHTYQEKTRTIKGKRYKTAYFGIETDGWGGDELRTNLNPKDCDAEFYITPDSKSYEHDKHSIVASWDSRGFMIHVIGQDNIQKLKELKTAFEKGDIVFGGGVSEFDRMGGRGLSFGIFSKLNPDVAVNYYSSNVNRVTLYEEIAKTEIIPELRDAKKGWYAMQPRKKADTGEIQVYLNPREQQKYKSGWFNIQDLKDWANNTGIILKENNNNTPTP